MAASFFTMVSVVFLVALAYSVEQLSETY